jgi:hypothetical protein
MTHPAASLKHPLLRLICAITLSCSSLAHAGPHVHGEMALGVAIDGPTVTVDFKAPLDSLLGFERAPRSSAEKALLRRWDGLLRNPSTLIRFDEAAGCSLQTAEFDSPVPGLGELDAAASSDHAEVEGAWVFACKQPAALKALKLGLFEQTRHLHRIHVLRLNAQGSAKQVLKRPAHTIALAP